MAKEYEKVKVKKISIVTGNMKPVNGKKAIIKGENFLKAEKIDKIKGLIYCTVMQPDEVDSQGDFFGRDAIKKACHDFMKETAIHEIDENHNRIVKSNVYVVESYINDAGAWKAVIDISEDSELMQKAVNNEINGVSIDGFANEVKKGLSEKIDSMLEVFKGFINKNDNKNKISKGENMDALEVAKIVQSEIKKALEDNKRDQENLLKAQQEKEDREALKKEIEEQKKEIEELKKAITNSDAKKDDTTVTASQEKRDSDIYSF